MVVASPPVGGGTEEPSLNQTSMERLEFREKLLYPGISPTIHCITCKPNNKRNSRSQQEDGTMSKHTEENNIVGQPMIIGPMVQTEPESFICGMCELVFRSIY
ncbi:unnamed protein product, partial [Meganyctiphanes norvegica]